jgi:hypothetical protein
MVALITKNIHQPEIFYLYSEIPTAVCFDHLGKRLAVGTDKGHVHIYSVIRHREWLGYVPFRANQNISAMFWRHDDKIFIAGNRGVEWVTPVGLRRDREMIGTR